MPHAALIVAACVCLVLASAAAGATRSYLSPHPGADDVSFDATLKHGKVTKVTNLYYSGFLFPCSPAPYSFSAGPFDDVKVKHDRFRLEPYGKDPKAVFTGKFNGTGEKVTGRYTVKGTFPGPLQCEGSHSWTSKRVV